MRVQAAVHNNRHTKGDPPCQRVRGAPPSNYPRPRGAHNSGGGKGTNSRQDGDGRRAEEQLLIGGGEKWDQRREGGRAEGEREGAPDGEGRGAEVEKKIQD